MNMGMMITLVSTGLEDGSESEPLQPGSEVLFIWGLGFRVSARRGVGFCRDGCGCGDARRCFGLRAIFAVPLSRPTDNHSTRELENE